MSKRALRRSMGTFAALLLLAVIAWEWDTRVVGNHRILSRGVVVDENGHGIEGVRIEASIVMRNFWQIPIYMTGTTEHVSVTTDGRGEYIISKWRGQGVYDFHMHKEGFAPHWDDIPGAPATNAGSPDRWVLPHLGHTWKDEHPAKSVKQ